jgi:hypothetical protein
MKGSPAVMDFDGDGKWEVARMDLRGNIYMWDLSGAAVRDDHSWPMLQHDSARTGANIVEYKSSSIERSIPEAGALSFIVQGTDTVQAGSCAAQIIGTAPYGTAVFALRQNGVTRAGTVRGPFTIGGNGETAAFVDTFVSGLQEGFTGVLDIASSTGSFIRLSLRALTNDRNEFLISLFPVADLMRTAPSTVVFPQIAAGGNADQYSTEVILLGAGNARVTLKYFSDDGSPLPIVR